MKARKWYNSNIKPDKYGTLIIMTDMGWIFQGEYKNGLWYRYKEDNWHKMQLEEYDHQDSIIKWMKV